VTSEQGEALAANAEVGTPEVRGLGGDDGTSAVINRHRSAHLCIRRVALGLVHHHLSAARARARARRRGWVGEGTAACKQVPSTGLSDRQCPNLQVHTAGTSSERTALPLQQLQAPADGISRLLAEAMSHSSASQSSAACILSMTLHRTEHSINMRVRLGTPYQVLGDRPKVYAAASPTACR